MIRQGLHDARIRLLGGTGLALMVILACQFGGVAQLQPSATPQQLAPTPLPVLPGEVTSTPSGPPPGPTSAAGYAPGAVIVEQALNLNASQGGPVEVAFEAIAEQVIRIEAARFGGAVDYEMALVDQFGNYLATLDAHVGRDIETLTEFTLPFHGTYQLVLTPIDGVGTVNVRVTALGPPSGGGVIDEVPYSANGLISNPEVYHTYQFPLAEGDTVTIAARANVAGAPDLRMALYGPDGRFIAEVDDLDPPTDLNAVLPGFIAPLTGTYFAIVSNYGDAIGAYIFSITSDTEPPQAAGGPDIVYDNPYRAAFADRSTLAATFDGTVGDILRVDVTDPTAGLDVDIYLFSPFNQIIAYAVSQGAGEGEAISEVQLPYTGRYRLELRPIGSGQATFTLTRLPLEALTGGGLLGDGASATRSGAFTAPNTFHFYQFSAVAGDRITLRVTSAEDARDLDIGFALLGPSGRQLAFADDSDGNQPSDPALVDFEVRQTGAFTVVVYAFTEAAGAYDLSFSRER